MLLEEEHTVTSLMSPDMPSPGDTAPRARAGVRQPRRAAVAGGWCPPQGSCAVPACARSLQARAALATPPSSDPDGHWVTARSPRQADGPGSTVPARAWLQTASRRHSMAGKCRLLPSCTRSTSPSDTCTRPRRGGQVTGSCHLPQAGTTAHMRKQSTLLDGRGHVGAPIPQGNPPPEHTPASAGTGTAGPPSPALSSWDMPFLELLERGPGWLGTQEVGGQDRSILHPNAPLPSGSPLPAPRSLTSPASPTASEV